MTLNDRIQNALPLIEEILAIAGVPGISFGIIHRGEAIGTYHLGVRDVERGIKADDYTRYNINSLTKAFVSVLVGIEVLLGTENLNWLDPVSSWLPDFTSSSSEVQQHCTLVDLLSHRAGITGLDDFWMGAENVIYIEKSQVLATFGTLDAAKPFRTSFEYSNWGYEIASQVLEKVTDQPISKLLHDKIFSPLNMTRTSTSWDPSDDNEAKSYGILKDGSTIQVARPFSESGSAMVAVGGVKSTIKDLLVFYKDFMRETRVQYEEGDNPSQPLLFRNCRMLTTNHARLPGLSLREQGYALGWARSQLPGQLGRLSGNIEIDEEPIAGKGNGSTLVLYHHGCQPGSTSAVHLVPEIESGVVVLQNSMAAIDVPDFVGQLLLEIILEVDEPNDYVALSKAFHEKAVSHLDNIREELEQSYLPGTTQRPVSEYTGVYWNAVKSIKIEVIEEEGRLLMKVQGLPSQVYNLRHHRYDTFSWLIPYDEVVQRGRSVTYYNSDYYLVKFCCSQDRVTKLLWALDDNFPGEATVFEKDDQGNSVSNLWGFFPIHKNQWRVSKHQS